MKSCNCIKEGDGNGGKFSTVAIQSLFVGYLLLHFIALVATSILAAIVCCH